jgi:two-component system chemotaxis response regulator CheY
MMEDSTPAPKTTILVVDDEAHIVRVVAFKLRAAGFEVIEAFDGEEAWSRLREHKVDLVLTDQQMPVLDGIGLARRINADAELSGTPVLMLTARGFRLDPEEFAGSGIVEMIDKPFSPRVLVDRVRAGLGSAASRREAA